MDKSTLNFLEGINDNFLPLPLELWGLNYFPAHDWHFTVLTDDDIVFICSRQKLNGKGIYSAQTESFLSEYFKKRLGVRIEESITLKDLISYGRTDVDFYKIDEETYFMDFSV